jgi:AraC family ethanolamine operon transcriptional activator
MEDHLGRRFSLAELGLDLGISVRTLQYSFREQLGRPPMAELKRRRLRRLRQLLQQADHDNRSVAELMQAAGLLACGATAADYGRCWGESPRRTRQRRTMDA